VAKRNRQPPPNPNGYATPSPRPPVVHSYWEQRQMGNWTDYTAKRTPPRWLLDKIAEETITGKWNVKRYNRCDECNTFRASSGACNCY